MGNVQRKLSKRRNRRGETVHVKLISVQQKNRFRLGVNRYRGREVNASLCIHEQFNPDPKTFVGGILYYPVRTVFDKLQVGDIVCVVHPLKNAQNVRVQGEDLVKTDALFVEDFRYLTDLSTVQWLVEKGARVNQEVLLWSVVRNRVDIFRYLIDQGGVATEDVWRCLTRYCRTEMIGYLDERG